ncbi:hypothetical protein GGTG_09474 [Gaeumannomyces tritici R3-111a-1]|uniref:Uncharacterized protein n=1 Tax=Gaeumannomyces tritici (strain R3-111a-1) TaxID=644352 RepID=J3P7I3_GAET3|nr:hypothetical protein GGTG_09474 [Gaeumannomyces tritici R3-111a-1]EJT72614.1 hypothetical protein GGTG_09474 [Gaeumannomyces tritici R3-111a-1]
MRGKDLSTSTVSITLTQPSPGQCFAGLASLNRPSTELRMCGYTNPRPSVQSTTFPSYEAKILTKQERTAMCVCTARSPSSSDGRLACWCQRSSTAMNISIGTKQQQHALCYLVNPPLLPGPTLD